MFFPTNLREADKSWLNDLAIKSMHAKVTDTEVEVKANLEEKNM